MALQPSCQGGGGAIRQQVNRPPTLQVDEDGAVRVPLEEGEVIHPKESGRGRGGRREGPRPSEQGVAAGGEGQAVTPPRPGLPADGESHVPLGVDEVVGRAGVRPDVRKPLAEDDAGTAIVAAAEAEGGDPPHHPPPVRVQVGDGAEVAAVDVRRAGVAHRAGGKRGGGDRRDHDPIGTDKPAGDAHP